ncbi:GRP family sugar transporter [Mitsuokella multacida]|uniref:GRP family sugar transporter n=1 Tax=Mitsuokella multacida TaxID=52226 RepID=UPI003F7EC5D7
MEYLIALLPALCWGSLGIFSTKFGGNSSQQTMGLTLGGLLFGFLSYFLWVMPHGYYIDGTIVMIGLISGILWTVGQAFQFVAIKVIGAVSIAVTLSMTSQLVGNALLAAALLGNWADGTQWGLGLFAVTLIVIGALFIQKKDKRADDGEEHYQNLGKGLIPLAFSTLGFVGYFITPKLLQIWLNVAPEVISAGNGVDYMITIIFPQSVGMVLGSFIYIYLISHQTEGMFAKVTFKNGITGLVWAVGNVAMLISIARLDQAVATTLSQLGFIVSAFGGMYILHEKKSSSQLKRLVIGVCLAVIGAVIITNIRLVETLIW